MEFKNKKTLIPVIHVVTKEHLMDNMRKINKIGIQHVFLISHGYMGAKELIKAQKALKETFPNIWIGVNFLDIKSYEVFNVLKNDIEYLDGIWIDNSHVGINIEEEYEKKLLKAKKEANFSGTYFGGVAFKYCLQPLNLRETCIEAKDKMDIITTSGPGTGESADLEKIKLMKEAINDAPLAIASGISSKNVNEYLKYIDIFLVASSIEESNGVLDYKKTEELYLKIKNYKLEEEKA